MRKKLFVYAGVLLMSASRMTALAQADTEVSIVAEVEIQEEGAEKVTGDTYEAPIEESETPKATEIEATETSETVSLMEVQGTTAAATIIMEDAPVRDCASRVEIGSVDYDSDKGEVICISSVYKEGPVVDPTTEQTVIAMETVHSVKGKGMKDMTEIPAVVLNNIEEVAEVTNPVVFTGNTEIPQEEVHQFSFEHVQEPIRCVQTGDKDNALAIVLIIAVVVFLFILFNIFVSVHTETCMNLQGIRTELRPCPFYGWKAEMLEGKHDSLIFKGKCYRIFVNSVIAQCSREIRIRKLGTGNRRLHVLFDCALKIS